MQKTTTTNLEDFGNIEKETAANLLKAWRLLGLPKDFEDSEVKIMFNLMSGFVFLTNANGQVAMLTGTDNLESFYTCCNCNNEGFADEIGFDVDQGLCGDCKINPDPEED